MPLTTQTALQAYFMPDDADVALAAMIAALDSAKLTIRVIAYGFTHPQLIDALIRAHVRGVNVKLILDLTQSKGVAEVPQLHRLMLTIPPANVRIGTSTLHQIIHDKVAIIDGLAQVPDGQFDTIDAARAAGYPLTLEGSLNWSPSGLKQVNTLLCLPSKTLGAYFHTLFDAQWAWLDTHEPQYQPTAA